MPSLQFQPFLVPKKNALKSRKRFQQRVNHVKKSFFSKFKVFLFLNVFVKNAESGAVAAYRFWVSGAAGSNPAFLIFL